MILKMCGCVCQLIVLLYSNCMDLPKQTPFCFISAIGYLTTSKIML